MQIDENKKLLIDRCFSVSIASYLTSFAGDMTIEKPLPLLNNYVEVDPDELRTNEVIEIMCEESMPTTTLQFTNKKRRILKK